MNEPAKPPDTTLLDQSAKTYQSGSKAASWVFGAVLIGFLMYSFIFMPHLTPAQCGMLRFFMALTAGLFFLFFVGGIVLQGHLKGFGVGAGGGVALFFLIQFVVNPVPGCVNPLPISHPFKHTFTFGQPAFALSMPNDHTWNHGVSSLDQADELSGKQVSIDKLRVTLGINNNQQLVCCDVWLYLSPTPFGLRSGGGSLGIGYPPYDEPSSAGKAPVLAKFVIGSGGTAFPQGPQTFWVAYDFQKQAASGYPQVDNIKQTVSQSMNIDRTLYAQVFVWSGNPAINIDVTSIKLEIEGTWSTKTGD